MHLTRAGSVGAFAFRFGRDAGWDDGVSVTWLDGLLAGSVVCARHTSPTSSPVDGALVRPGTP
eukprot:scaffold317021_cov31-Tisochrysis_lutea.AAC.3